jgi:hypothetical protein
MITSCTVAFNDIKHLARSMPADGLEAQDIVPPRLWLSGCPHGHFRRGYRFLGKAHTLARALSRRSACNHLEIAAGDGHGWLWSVVAEAVVRACLTSISSAPAAFRFASSCASEDIGLVIEDTAANARAQRAELAAGQAFNFRI